MGNELREQIDSIVKRICFLFPNINKDELELKVRKLAFVESNDITDSRPMVYDEINNALKINYDVLNNDSFDAEYLLTTQLLMLTLPYYKELSGIRYGYFAGVASNLVGNFVKETEDELIPGIDPYESVRDVVQELSSKIGPVETAELCTAKTPEVFYETYLNSGLENPGSFINQMNYLLLNSLNISDRQNGEIVSSLKSEIPEVNLMQKKFI